MRLCGGTCLQACLLGVGSSRGKHLHTPNTPSKERKSSHRLIGSNESPIWLGGLSRPMGSPAMGFWLQHRTLFPRQKVNGNREQSLGRRWLTFENQDPDTEPVLVPSLMAKGTGLLQSWGGGCAMPRGELRTRW